MNLWLRASAVGMIFAFAGNAAAAASTVEASPIPRDPKPNFTSMRFLAGRWECQVASARRPRPFATHVTTTIGEGGYWLVTRTITDPVPWNPIRITNTEYVTYDASNARWVDLGLDDYGAYDVSVSNGWTGDRIVWNEIAYPKLHGAATNDPRTIRKLSPSRTIESTALREPSGKRIVVTTTCEKSG